MKVKKVHVYSPLVRVVHGRFHLLFFIFPGLTLDECYRQLRVDALFVFPTVFFLHLA